MMFTKTLKKKLLTQAAVLAAPLLLVGCSSVPDAVNPVEWYRSSVEYFSSDEPTETAATTSSEDGVSETEQAAPKKVESGFVAAKSSQRSYAQPIMRQGEVVNALGDEPVVNVAEQPPAPQAAPSSPVLTKTLDDNVSQRMASSSPSSSNTVVQASPSQTVTLTPPAATQADNRSVSEIYAANIAQTRPDQLNSANPRGGYDTYAMPQFETVVVSSSGVAGGGYASYQQQYAPQQYASLTQNVQTDVRDTMTSSMMFEPSVVQQGLASSMRAFNPAMFSGSFQVATIQFGNGSANLTSEDMRILREVLNIHHQQGGVIRIVGHASSRTRDMAPTQHEQVNEKMSVIRADKVARELLRLGMSGERLFVGGVSDSQPLYQEVMPSGEAGNRRTEIFVDY